MTLRVAVLTVLGVLFVGLDLARPYTLGSAGVWLWLAGLGLLAAAGELLSSRRVSWRRALPFLALGLLLLPTILGQVQELGSDGIQYYAYWRSLAFDFDLEVRNDYALLGWNPDQPPVLPIGAPLLWSPLLFVVHLGRQGLRLFGASAPTGVEPIYQATACLASLAYGAAGLFLLLDTLKRWAPPAAAFWATVLVWVGSPLRFYLSVLPAFAHGAEFFAAVLVVRGYLSLRERPSPRRALLAGAACGLAFLTRPQDALLLGLPGLDLLWQWLRGPERRSLAWALGALGTGFVLAALPQILVWQITFGVPVLVPHQAIHGASFLHFGQPQLLATLISPRGGLFTSHPVLLVASLGLCGLALLDRRYVLGVLPVLLGMWYLNASVFDWYQVRRFTGLVPLLAPALAVALAPLSRAGAPTLALTAFLVLRFDLAVDSLRSAPGDAAPPRAALHALADGLAADAYGVLEPVAPRAAVGLLAAYTGETVLTEPVTEIALGGETTLLRLPRPARHVSGVEVEDGRACRWITSQDARLFLPVARGSEVIVTMQARALETVEPQFVELLWNDVAAERLPMMPAWSSYRFHVPRSAVRAGTNVLLLRFERAPIFHRTRGHGPKEVRPAAIESLTLHRGPGS